jgi:hypothetical protein
MKGKPGDGMSAASPGQNANRLRQTAPYPDELAALVVATTYRPGWTFRLADIARDRVDPAKWRGTGHDDELAGGLTREGRPHSSRIIRRKDIRRDRVEHYLGALVWTAATLTVLTAYVVTGYGSLIFPLAMFGALGIISWFFALGAYRSRRFRETDAWLRSLHKSVWEQPRHFDVLSEVDEGELVDWATRGWF